MSGKMSKPEFKEKGGQWMSVLQDWFKNRCHIFEGLDEPLPRDDRIFNPKPPFTVKEFEDLAADIAFAVLGVRTKSGKWLGRVREWIQWNCRGGDSVTWGSNDQLISVFSIFILEDMAGEIAYAAYEDGLDGSGSPPSGEIQEL